MYSGFQLCARLEPGEKCFRLRKYEQGEFIELFHEHVPAHRISQDNAMAALKSLVLRYQEAEAGRILRHYLNGRGSSPKAEDHYCLFHVEYPEPGVIRKYCGINIEAWMDEVIDPGKFRE